MSESSFFDIKTLAASLPESAETMLADIRLTDEAAASCRIFRVYRPAPAHFHQSCDEYLYVLSGSAEMHIGVDPPRILHAGELVFFRKGVVHALPEILEHPFVVLAIDTPRRPPTDIHFVNPADGSAEGFLRTYPGS